MSLLWDARGVNEKIPIDIKALIGEITRYLAAIDIFRAEGCGPTWRPELAFTAYPSVGEFAAASEAAAALGRRIGPAGTS